MTGHLVVTTTEITGECTLIVLRDGDDRPYVCELTADQVTGLIAGLTEARRQMSPFLPTEWTPTMPTPLLPDMQLHVPRQQSFHGGLITYKVRHPGHGWLAGQVTPEQAADLYAGFMVHAAGAWRQRRDRPDPA